MSGEESSSKPQKKYDVQPNFSWPPARYYMLASYVLFYNAIANDPKKYGLENSNGNQVINAYIKDHWRELDAEYHTNLEAVQAANNKPPLKCASFESDLPHLIAETNRISLPYHNDGKGNLTGILSNQEVKELLEEKRKDVRSYHEHVRKNSKGKFGDYDKDKPVNGLDYEKYNQALADYKNKRTIIRRQRIKLILKAVASLAFAGLTVFSVGALLSAGGMAITSLFGSLYSASSLGTAVLGVAGTVVGAASTKHFFGSFLEDHAEFKRLKQDMREFKKGYGKYADKDNKHFGLKQIEQRYYADKAIKEYLEKGYVKGRRNKKIIRMIKTGKLGIPMEPSDFVKEPAFYQFVTDAYSSSKKNYGFRYIENLLGEAKAFNSSDTQSVQSHVVEAQNAIANPNLGLEDTVRLVRNLKTAEGKFQGDDKFDYDKLMNQYSDKLVDCIRNQAFENAYSSTTYSDLDNAFKDPLIKERLEHTSVGDKVDDVENIVKFVKASNSYLKPDVGVSIMDQVKMTPANMEHGVQSLGLNSSDPEYANVQTVIGNISSMTSRASHPTIDTQIATLGVSTPVKKYLKFMLYKKFNQTKQGLTDLTSIGDSTIQYAIANMTSSSSADSIRTQIMASSIPDKAGAVELLNKQVKAIEDKKKDDIYANVVGAIKENASPVVGDYISKISDMKTFEIDQIKELRNDIVKKTGNKAVSDFLVMKFQSKVEELLGFEIGKSQYSGTGPEVLKNITNILKTISELEEGGFISSAQKIGLVTQLEPKISSAVQNILRISKEQFMTTDYDEKKFADIIKQSYSEGGLKEYFALNTPESNDLKNDVEYMRNQLAVYGLAKSEIKFGGEEMKQSDAENRIFAEIYFSKDRDSSTDKLYKELEGMALNQNNDEMVYGQVCPTDGAENDIKNSPFIRNMMASINEINSWSDVNDKFAAMLILKKRCIVAYKKYVNNFYGRNRGTLTIDQYMSDPSRNKKFVDDVYNQWVYGGNDTSKEGILKIIDKKLREYSRGRGDRKFTSAEESANTSKTASKAAQYASQPGM